MKAPYWILEIGDEPGSEIVIGPIQRYDDALMNARSKFSSYFWRMPGILMHDWGQKEVHIIGWNSSLSTLFIVQRKTKPTYEKYIRPELLKKGT
jgi:hypothetical protein